MTTKRERAQTIRLIQEFGADVMVTMRDYQPLKHSTRTFARFRAAERTADCADCGLCENGRAGPEYPDGPARIAVVGEAPSDDEVQHARPFVGRAGRVLRGALQAAGIDPDDCAYILSTACQPLKRDSNNSKVTFQRPPTAEEQSACHGNLMASLEAANVQYVLLLGAHAVRSWRADVQLTTVAGKWFLWGSRWFVYPMWHPNAVLRQAFSAVEWREQIGRFVQTINDDDAMEHLHRVCINPKCGKGVWVYDSDGVPWCQEHMKWDQQEVQDKLRAKRQHGQGSML